MDRRAFLYAAAALPASARAGWTIPVQDASSAIAGRTPGVALRSSVAAYGFRRELGATPPQMELEDVIEFAAREALDGVELTSYWFREQSASYVAKLRRHAAVNGLCISGMPIRSDFTIENAEARAAELATVTKWIEVARDLGAHTVRVFAGNAKRGMTRDAARQLVIDGLAQSAEVAARCGVVLGIENHGFLTETAADVLALVAAVGSSSLAVNLDTGNFAKDAYREMAALAPAAVAVQVKLLVKNADGLSEPCEFERVADLLRAAAYRGFVALEYEGDGETRSEIQMHLQRLLRALRG